MRRGEFVLANGRPFRASAARVQGGCERSAAEIEVAFRLRSAWNGRLEIRTEFRAVRNSTDSECPQSESRPHPDPISRLFVTYCT